MEAQERLERLIELTPPGSLRSTFEAELAMLSPAPIVMKDNASYDEPQAIDLGVSADGHGSLESQPEEIGAEVSCQASPDREKQQSAKSRPRYAIVHCWSSRFWRQPESGELLCARCYPPLPGIETFDVWEHPELIEESKT